MVTTYEPRPHRFQSTIDAMDRVTARVTKDRETARKWLLENGFVTEEDIRKADEAALASAQARESHLDAE